MAYGAKVQQLITNPTGGLGPPQLALLKEVAIAACDSRDGVTDRVVEDPRSCTFDPGAIACSPSKSSACLTPTQVEAARSIYAGVVNPRSGERIFPGPAPAGEPSMGRVCTGRLPDRCKLLALARLDGWTDPGPEHDRLLRESTGGDRAEQVKDSVRLFMAPGVDHCSGGKGTFLIDALEAIDAWVQSRPSSWSPAVLSQEVFQPTNRKVTRSFAVPR